jgi:hypothetical protein
MYGKLAQSRADLARNIVISVLKSPQRTGEKSALKKRTEFVTNSRVQRIACFRGGVHGARALKLVLEDHSVAQNQSW